VDDTPTIGMRDPALLTLSKSALASAAAFAGHAEHWSDHSKEATPMRRPQPLVRCALLVLLLLLSCRTLALATAQAPDVISVAGENNPLETYLSQHSEMRPSRLASARFGLVIGSSDNWRGYVASWALVENALVVKDVRVQIAMDGQTTSVIRDIWPDAETVVATWFSGHLIIPTGQLRRYVHMGYASEYDRYLLVTVKEGSVVRNCRLGREEFVRFRAAQYAAFKKTDTYRAALAKARADGDMSPKELEQFLYEYLTPQYMETIFE
jgi:hypothetical protein